MNQMTQSQSKSLVNGTAANSDVIRSDILVPYIVQGQGLSDAVVAKKVQMGDIYRSTNGEVLGGPDKPLDVVFLHYPKSNWIYEEEVGSKFQYRRTEPRTAANETLPWKFWLDAEGNEVPEGTKKAVTWRRVKQLLTFAVLLKDVEAAKSEMAKAAKGELPDPSKALTPVILSFRSSSFKAGKEVCTFFTQAASMSIPIYKYSLKVGNYLEKNDDGAFYVWQVDRNKAKAVTKEALELIEPWVQMINSGVKLETDEAAENVAAAPVKPVTEVC